MQYNIKISDKGEVTGVLKHVKDFTAFDTTNNTGNFLALSFPEAKAGQTVTCEVKGEGAVLKRPVEVDKNDGLMILKIANNNQTIEVVNADLGTRTLTLKDLVLEQK